MRINIKEVLDMRVNKTLVRTLGKVGKFVGPVATGAMAILTDMEDRKQKETIEMLVKRVTELEKQVSRR